MSNDMKITEKEYRKHSALAQSELKLILKSPIHFQLRKEPKETDEMRFGTAFHTALLEPSKFRANYFVLPSTLPNGEPLNKRKKDHKEYIEQVKADNLDKVIIEEDDVETLTGMLNAVRCHPVANQLFTGGEPEVSHFWEHRGRQCKGRFDYMHTGGPWGNCLVELKTTKDASPNKFSKDVWNLGWDFQQAFYNIGVGRHFRHIVVAVEKVFPYAIGVYDFTSFIEIGIPKVEKAFDILEECERTNNWYGYTNGLEVLNPASWMVGLSGNENE